jgi:predicted nuclease with TOPRIM domain
LKSKFQEKFTKEKKEAFEKNKASIEKKIKDNTKELQTGLDKFKKSSTKVEGKVNFTSESIKSLTADMNALNGKLDQESITKSIDLREKLTEMTNQLDSLKAE